MNLKTKNLCGKARNLGTCGFDSHRPLQQSAKSLLIRLREYLKFRAADR
jgi:hypothetical protein